MIQAKDLTEFEDVRIVELQKQGLSQCAGEIVRSNTEREFQLVGQR